MVEYKDIPEITYSKREFLLGKLRLSKIESLMLKKHYLQCSLVVDGRSYMSIEDQEVLFNAMDT